MKMQKEEKFAIGFTIASIAVWLALVGAGVWVTAHFIAKFW